MAGSHDLICMNSVSFKFFAFGSFFARTHIEHEPIFVITVFYGILLLMNFNKNMKPRILRYCFKSSVCKWPNILISKINRFKYSIDLINSRSILRFFTFNNHEAGAFSFKSMGAFCYNVRTANWDPLTFQKNTKN